VHDRKGKRHVVGFDRICVLDLELRPSGLRLNAVAPQQLDPAKAAAQFIAYLVSDAAAPISGAIVPAHGP
jgi:hypothetical protein